VINGSGITISRDGTTIYVGGKGGNPALTTFSTAPFAVMNNYSIGSGLAIYGLTVSPDGRYLFTTDNYGAASTAQFHIIDLQAGGGPAEVPGSPFLSNVNVVRSYP
jgi:DNA-binding beta-propeller fold protein YncE